ncbi:hypothetical protein [Citrobacter braakii]|uniref:hypothetical protein n=1 Tax=Citrobacter braakii TaxID=57706 RepID=UPI003D99170C
MTTNHPAHGPVSLDRLHQIREILSKASAQSDGGNLGYAMADAVKVIDGVIAVFGAEPVITVGDDGADALAYRRLIQTFPPGTKLYTAPPLQVVPEALLSAMEEVLRISDRDHDAWHKVRNSIASCRAAMLQAGNSPVIPDAYDIEAFGMLSATEGDSGLMIHIEQFRFVTESFPQLCSGGFVPKFALQAIINRLQVHCNGMRNDEIIDDFASEAAPQQEVIGIDLANGKDASVEVVIENGKVISHG